MCGSLASSAPPVAVFDGASAQLLLPKNGGGAKGSSACSRCSAAGLLPPVSSTAPSSASGKPAGGCSAGSAGAAPGEGSAGTAGASPAGSSAVPSRMGAHVVMVGANAGYSGNHSCSTSQPTVSAMRYRCSSSSQLPLR